MIFGISDQDLLDKSKIKIINGIAGSGKSTSTVSELERLGEKFCLASFSNALKFAASDKFGCTTDTICGLCFKNSPYPRSAEKEVTEFSTVILDEILLDGIECINWMKHNVGKVNIICLTDSRQMLQAENAEAVIKTFNRLIKTKKIVYVELDKTKRARNPETVAMYDDLFNIESKQIYTLDQVQKMFDCDIVDFNTISYNAKNTYICHSNRIEHEVYKSYDLSTNRSNNLIPKNHIARNRKVDFSKYPICDQITATEKKVNAYLQVSNVATPTRFQGKEVEVGNDLYFIVEEGNMFTGREIYTVGTRCQDKKSIHIAIIKVDEYKDPTTINGMKVISNVKRLDLDVEDKTFHRVQGFDIDKIIEKHGEFGQYYYRDIITSGDNVVYSSKSSSALKGFCDIEEDKGVMTVTYKKKTGGAKRSIQSIVKKDVTMHFDFMPRVYEILNADVNPARINNPASAKNKDFDKLCDLYSAFPTILHFAPMPAAGFLYEEYDKDLLNWYVYHGDKVTNGALITEALADKIGESEYVFSTAKQTGCELGHYTYEQAHASKEKKANVNKNFLWGILEKNYYDKEIVSMDGQAFVRYVKHPKNNLELISCALWSELSLIMLNAIDSIKATSFVVKTDGLFYNGDKIPKFPPQYDFRIEDKKAERLFGKIESEKYGYVDHKTYDDPPTENEKAKERMRKKRASMTEEEKAIARAKDAERKRKKRASNK